MGTYTAQKIKFSIKNVLSTCDQIHRKLRIWSHLLKKSLMENFIFCSVLEDFIQKFTQNLEKLIQKLGELIQKLEEFIQKSE